MPVVYTHNHTPVAHGARSASALLQTRSGRCVYITELTANVVVLRKIRYRKMSLKAIVSVRLFFRKTFEHDIESCESSSGSKQLESCNPAQDRQCRLIQWARRARAQGPQASADALIFFIS